jgi:hypothetical protein
MAHFCRVKSNGNIFRPFPAAKTIATIALHSLPLQNHLEGKNPLKVWQFKGKTNNLTVVANSC